MAKRPTSNAKTSKRKLQRVDPKRTLQPEQVDHLKEWAQRTRSSSDPLDVRNGFIVLVLLGTGARRFELCAFRCGDFTMGPSGPIARFDESKGNKEADVPISLETWQHVQSWFVYKRGVGQSVSEGAPLFCGRAGEHMAPATLSLIWDSVLEQVGLPKRQYVGVHVTRHAAGMLFLQATKSLADTAEFLRHSSARVTERFYKHVLPSDIRAGLTKAGL